MFERDLNWITNRLKLSTKLFQLHTIPNYDDLDCSKWKVLFVIEKSIGWQSSAGRKLYLLVTFSWCIVALVTFSLYSYCLIDTDTNILKTAKEKYTDVYHLSWPVKEGHLIKNEKVEHQVTLSVKRINMIEYADDITS